MAGKIDCKGIIFKFPYGNYEYDQRDIDYYGMRVIVADCNGKKFRFGQRVDSAKADLKDGVVTDVGLNSVTISCNKGDPRERSSFLSPAAMSTLNSVGGLSLASRLP